MSPRKRINKGLVDNLYQGLSRGSLYYKYKHPITGKMHGMGSDKGKANAAARILNAKLLSGDVSLVDRVLDVESILMHDLIDLYLKERIPDTQLKSNTLKAVQYRLNRINKDLGHLNVKHLNTLDCSQWLESFEGNPYVKHRGTLIDLFRFAENKGFRNSNTNPAMSTYPRRLHKEKVRRRLTIDQYKVLHANAEPYMKIALELGLVTLLGRLEITRLRYDSIVDGFMYVVRQKSENHEWSRLKIKMTPELISIVDRSRDGLLTPYIVHRRPKRKLKNKETDHWTQLAPNLFTKEFRVLRDSLEIFQGIPKDERPTFHEVRALGSWLYEKNGFDRKYVKELMAHADESMTEHYQSDHEVKWMSVSADLKASDFI